MSCQSFLLLAQNSIWRFGVKSEVPDGRVVELPRELAVAAEYGLTLLETSSAPRVAAAGVLHLSNDGQQVLQKHGFDAPLLRHE